MFLWEEKLDTVPTHWTNNSYSLERNCFQEVKPPCDLKVIHAVHTRYEIPNDAISECFRSYKYTFGFPRHSTESTKSVD